MLSEKVKLASDISKRTNLKYRDLLRLYSIERLRQMKSELDAQKVKPVTAPIKELVKVAKQRKQYRKNISTAELRTIYKQQQEDNKISTLKNNVSTFTTSNTPGTLTIKNINEKKFKAVLQSINIKPGFRYSLKTGNKFITIKPETIARIRNLPFTQIIENNTAGSDNQFVYNVFSQTELSIIKKSFTKTRSGGSFFPYLNQTDIDLSRYQIFNVIDKNNYINNCLIHALIQSKLFTDKEINNVKLFITDRHFPVCKLNKVAEILKCKITLSKMEDQQRTRKYGTGNKNVCIGLISDHYFINEKTNYNAYSIENYYQVCDQPEYNKIYRKRGNSYVREERFINSFDLINLMLSNKLFKPIDLSSEILDTQYYDRCADSITSLEYTNSNVIKMKCTANDKEFNGVYYADFETTTEDVHKPYLCCITGTGIPDYKAFKGQYCGHNLLDYLPSGSLCYFHNLGYDFSFIMKYLIVQTIIKSGSQIKLVKGVFNKKQLTFKDSKAIINEPLVKFSKMFKLTMKKEIMPYALYTQENINKSSVLITDALIHVKEHEKAEFEELAKPYIRNEFEFLHMDYAEFYCAQDCRVLKNGFEIFRQWIINALGLDILQFVSICSLANRYLFDKKCFDNCYLLSGVPQLFIQKCIKGGRVMTCENKKQKPTVDKIQDFDAVNLYSSAMSRLSGFLQGKPKVLKQNQLNMNFLNKCSSYYIEINNVSIGKSRKFPLQSQKNKNGIRDYINKFSDSLYVDKVELEDLIKYQQATFDIVRGYYFNEGYNTNIVNTIKELFNLRVQKKAEKNPIEQLYKLIMNSAYGKLIQKPIKTDLKFKNTETEHKKYINMNHNFIKEYSNICPGKYVYTVQKNINKHFNMVHLGAQVLSMSKRIMNEVMCLADDLNINIYYQDTDSMHIDDHSIKTLSDEYKKLYNRDLIGESMGQFHSDFSGGNYATKSIFLGKKCYLDVLDTGKLHIRMKGISDNAIHAKGDVIETYEKLYKGEAVEFDLCKGKAIFKHESNFQIKTLTEFKRKVQF